MAKGEYLGEFEQIIMLAVLRLRDTAYGMEVRREIEARTGRDASIGAVYTTLDRLEKKGLVRSYESAPDNDSGRPLRLYKITAPGEASLESTRSALARMSRSVRIRGAKGAQRMRTPPAMR